MFRLVVILLLRVVSAVLDLCRHRSPHRIVTEYRPGRYVSRIGRVNGRLVCMDAGRR